MDVRDISFAAGVACIAAVIIVFLLMRLSRERRARIFAERAAEARLGAYTEAVSLLGRRGILFPSGDMLLCEQEIALSRIEHIVERDREDFRFNGHTLGELEAMRDAYVDDGDVDDESEEDAFEILNEEHELPPHPRYPRIEGNRLLVRAGSTPLTIVVVRSAEDCEEDDDLS